MLKHGWILAAALAWASLLGVPDVSAAGAFTLSSSSFRDGGQIALKYGGNDKANPNCAGDNISPALAWTSPPQGTRSFALLFMDPDGRPPSGFAHMIAYGIPAEVTGFAEGDMSKPSDKFVGGINTGKFLIDRGPCPPPGILHHYVFTLFATDLEPKALKEGLTRDELVKALEGHAIGAAGLFGTFVGPARGK